MILKHGAKIDSVDTMERTPLFIAALCGNTKIVNLFLDHNANPRHVSSDGKMAAHWAAYSGRISSLQYKLIAPSHHNSLNIYEPPSPHIRDSRGLSLLHMAVWGAKERKHINCIRYLIQEKNLNVNLVDHSGQTPLHIASRLANSIRLDIVRTLIEYGAFVNKQDDEGRTPLHVASPENISLLIQHGGDINIWSLNTFPIT
eukprot:TRINITY_DN1810_c0_g1_i6.p1 TRINITY_DN1810_c0_g1~~TRINITY_DN1810_c0_g1_i6.p1  ORF type:complete len:201 (+),score=15.41 TRINITY_DN1810_c0_g1_i6:399-1001(+)